ncbi:MAG: VWA domain-containing protein [Phycisphaerales bacterium]|nr:MAG: VWA domain-containing protein [Phycisphaerales bacterium]
MIFANYPGHLIVISLLAASTAAVLFVFRSGEFRKAKLKRYRVPLAVLQYVPIVLLLVILWNPSRSKDIEMFSRRPVLALFDTSESMSTIETRAATRLDAALQVFREELRPSDPEGPEYRIFGFDRRTYHSGSLGFLRRWGSGTDMHSVRDLLGRYDLAQGDSQEDASSAGGKVAGAVIFTDGQAADKNVNSYLPLHSNDLQIVVIGVGSRSPQSDVAVKSMTAPSRVMIDTTYSVQVALVATHVNDQPVTVELLKDGAAVDSKRLSPEPIAERTRDRQISNPAVEEMAVEFTVSADRLGIHTLSARVEAVAQEVDLANNQRSAMVEVVQEERVKVLFYSQTANLDIGKVRQALARDSKIDLDLGLDVIKIPGLSARAANTSGYVRLPEDRAGFYKYDVLVLGPCDLDGLRDSQIDGLYSFVVDRGGGLILLPGRDTYGPAGWQNAAIRSLIPVIFASDEPGLRSRGVGRLELTPEGTDAAVASVADLEDHGEPTLAFYQIADTKPASATLAVVDDAPIISVHRVGRGRVCLLNASRLFQWYREDLEGGLLYKVMSGLTAYLGRTSSLEAGVELFAERANDRTNKVKFNAYVCDESFAPVAGANVLLRVAGQVLSMRPADRGRYVAEIEDVGNQTIVAAAQAETNGMFLGEKTIAANLPPAVGEMTNIELNEEFLRAFAKRLNGRYFHADDIDEDVAKLFEARRSLGTTTRMSSVWPNWPLLLILCLLLSTGWFLRRAIGLV